MKRIWLDVGAHLGERTLRFAQDNPSLTVYAFEPNLALVRRLTGVAFNFVVLPLAVSEVDGYTDFHITVKDGCSSILPIDAERVRGWKGIGNGLEVVRVVHVPSIRLDTFMAWAEIPRINFLKVDAQGADLSVVRSAGDRLRDIRRIRLEVAVTPSPYVGAASREEVLDFMAGAGFVLRSYRDQSLAQEQNLTFVREEVR